MLNLYVFLLCKVVSCGLTQNNAKIEPVYNWNWVNTNFFKNMLANLVGNPMGCTQVSTTEENPIFITSFIIDPD